MHTHDMLAYENRPKDEEFWSPAEYTYRKAKLTAPEKPSRLVIKTAPVVLQPLAKMAPRQFLLKRLNLERGMLVSLCGTGSAGKTLFGQYLAMCLANGLPLLGQFASEKGPHSVLHIDQEQSENLTKRRYVRLASGLGCTGSVERTVLDFRIDDPTLPAAEVESELIKACRPHSLVILDSLRQSVLCDENNSQISTALNMLKRVAEKANVVFMFIHHKGKNIGGSKQSGRGSSSIYDSVDVQIDLDGADGVLTLSCAKNRDGIYWDGFQYRLEDAGEWDEGQNCRSDLVLTLLADKLCVREADAQREILATLANNAQAKHGYLYTIIKGTKARFDVLITQMVQQQLLIESRGPHNSRMFAAGPNAATYMGWAI